MEAQTTTSSEDIVFRLLGWLHANRKPVIIGTVVVVVVGIGVGLYSWKQGQDEIEANGKLLSQPVGNDLTVHASGNTLSELASQYSSTPAGEFAALLAAENLFVSGKYAEAGQAFAKFETTYPSSSLLAEAGLGAAASLEAQNKTSEATQKYQQVIQANPTDLSVVEPAKLTLGRLAEEQNRFDLAFMQYKELAQSQNPNDLWASEARERLQLMVSKHPELLKSLAPPSAASASAPVSPVAPVAAPTLSAAPASTLSASPARSNSTPHLLQMPAANTTTGKH